MKKFMRIITAVLLALVLTVQTVPMIVLGAGRAPDKYPDEYWDLQKAWKTALSDKNRKEIIRTGEAQITLFLGSADPVKTAAEWRKTNDVALSVLAGVVPLLIDEYIAAKDTKNIARMVKIGWPIEEQYHLKKDLKLTHVYDKYYRMENYPEYFWLMPEYTAALESGSKSRIVKAGEALVNHMLKGKSAEVKAKEWLKSAKSDTKTPGLKPGSWELSTLQPIVRKIREASIAGGDIGKIAAFLEIAWPIDEAYHLRDNKLDELEFVRLDYAGKRAYYNVPTDVYAEMPGARGNVIDYGAKYEPQKGVLFGEIASYTNRADYKDKQTPMYDQSSATIVFVRFETETFKDFDWMIKPQAEQGRILELAWNLYGEGESLDLVLNSRDKIVSEAKYMASLDAPVFLRFAAEMNVWEKPADAKKYINAFRFVADIMRKYAPNVAMVWSVSSVGTIGLKYETFYPGDKYVDWVGISLYTVKYHMGRTDQTDEGQAIFMTGKYANPVNLIKQVVEKYGDRKPIMVAEGGVENYSNKNKRDETAFALEQMRLMYGFLPVIYPQVKMMIWFNTVYEKGGGSPNNYALYNNPKAMKYYKELTGGSSYFIKLGQESADISYKKLGSSSTKVPASKVTLITYAPYLMYDSVNVRYYLNSQQLKSSSPADDYRQTFDLSGKEDGTYTLKVEVRNSSAVLKTVSYSLIKSGDSVTIKLK